MQMTIYIYIYTYIYCSTHFHIDLFTLLSIFYTHIYYIYFSSHVALSRAIQGQYTNVESDSLKHNRDVLVKLGFHISGTSSLYWWLWQEGCTCKYWIASGQQICRFLSIMNWLRFAVWWMWSLWWLVFLYKVVICD